MIIESIELKNFGSHKSLQASLDSSIVGVMGPNGSGKSTILKAIEFALTGGLDDKADTYVRATTDDKPASNADVTLTFRKNGQKGKIMRRVGKSPKRMLWWDGKEITKAGDIDALLREVFCADKQAIANAIFPGQGSLDRLLFGNQAERETLFMRLLLMGHLNTVENILDGQIQKLNGMVQDFGILEDDLNKQQTQANQTLNEINGKLAGIPDYSKSIEVITKTIESLNQLTGAEHKVELLSNNIVNANIKSQLELARTQLQALCNTDSNSDCEAFHGALTALRNSLTDIHTQKQELMEEKHERETIDVVHAEIERLQQDITKYKSNVSYFNNKLSNCEHVTQELVNTKRSFVKTNQEAVLLKEQRNKNADELIAYDSDLAKLHQSGELDKLKDLAEKLLIKQRDLQLKKQLMEVVSKLPKNNADTCCPICSSQLTHEMHDSAIKSINESEAELTKVNSQLTDVQTNICILENKEKELQHYIALKNADIKNLNARLLELMDLADPMPSASLDQLEEILNIKNSISSDLLITQSQIKMAEESMQLNQNKYSTSAWVSWAQSPTVNELNSQIENLNKKIVTVENSINTIQQSLDFYNKLIADHNKQITELETAKDNVIKLKTESEAYAQQANAIATELTAEVPDGAYAAIRELLQSKYDERQQLIGMFQATQQQLVNIKHGQQELEQKKLKQIKIVLTIEEMRQLKQTFNRQGLPMTYLNYRFEKLTELTQHNLNMLGSNFVISADPETPLSFLFQRLDQPNIGTLPQYKLSGGQRVRLSIAFLLAVQQMVLPEVSLLVLDEPSLHLDHEAVESLRDLLQNLGSTLASSEAQVIVCDHNPILLPAMGKVVTLTANN